MTNPDRVCDNCGRWVESNETYYRMRVEIVAEPGSTIELNDPDAMDDPGSELEKVIDQLNRMSEEEVKEAEDQVHESHEFGLCPECREVMHVRMKRHREILDFD